MTLPLEVTFLSWEQVQKIHRDQIDRYGGSYGLRDEGLVRSALAQPLATFEGEFLHPTLYVMAAAYLFLLVRNHGFVDGNKRVAAVVARVFLYINNIMLQPDEDEFYDIVDAAAQGKASKEKIAAFFEQNSVPRSK